MGWTKAMYPALFALLVGADAPVAAEKWALLIGINDYQHGGGEWDLRGCENDVRLTRQMLVSRYGFPEQHIKALLNAEATAQNITQAIEEWLIARPGPEDIVYFHFSGHGSQVRDQDGDEDDNYDEALCPSDLRSGDSATLVTDDQLKVLLDRIPARHVTAVIDACHSGTGTRDLALSRPRFVQYEPAPARERKRTLAGQQTTAPASMEGGTRARVTIAGCRPDQTAADAWIREGLYAGALTYNLVQAMQQAPGQLTYGDLMERVTRDMAGTFQQTPQIEGATELPIFGSQVSTAATAPYALVESVQGDQVLLDTSQLEGVTAGSIFVLFPEGETRFEGPGIGRLEIVGVEATRAEGKLLEGAEAWPGYRATEVLHQVAEERLRVLLEVADPALHEEIAGRLKERAFVELAAEGAHFDRRVRVEHLGEVLDGAVVFDGANEASVVGRDAEDLVAKLQPYLANAYLVKRLAGLDNPLAEFGVAVWADRSGEEGARGKFVQAHIGETIRFHFRAEQDCHLTLLNVGTSGQITVLFPNQYHPGGAVQGGKTYSTETEGEMPFVIRVAGPPGRELVKAIATRQPLDWRSLGMGEMSGGGVRSIEGSKSFADQLVRDVAAVYAATGQAEAETAQAPLLPVAGWATDYLIVESEP